MRCQALGRFSGLGNKANKHGQASAVEHSELYVDIKSNWDTSGNERSPTRRNALPSHLELKQGSIGIRSRSTPTETRRRRPRRARSHNINPRPYPPCRRDEQLCQCHCHRTRRHKSAILTHCYNQVPLPAFPEAGIGLGSTPSPMARTSSVHSVPLRSQPQCYQPTTPTGTLSPIDRMEHH